MRVTKSSPGIGFLDGRYVNLTGDTMTGVLTINVSSANALLLQDGSANDVILLRTSVTGATVFNEQGSDIDFRIESDTDANLFSLDASSSFIGVGVLAPSSLLHIDRQLDAQTAGIENMHLYLRNSVGTNNLGVGIAFTNSTDAADVGAKIVFVRSNTFSRGHLIFKTNGTASGGDNVTERMRIKTSGEVGIATASPATLFHLFGADNDIVQTVQINATSANITTADTFIKFSNSTDVLIGDISGTASSGVIAYNTFTGAHYVQLSDDSEVIQTGMIVIATGKVILNEGGIDYLPVVAKSTSKQQKTVFGVMSGKKSKRCKLDIPHNLIDILKNEGDASTIEGQRLETCSRGADGLPHTCEFNQGNNQRDLYQIFGLGTGLILVTNTNGNISVGDYIQTSNVAGYGEKQDDDILHNYTVAKSTVAVDWLLEATTKKLIPCTYHCS